MTGRALLLLILGAMLAGPAARAEMRHREMETEYPARLDARCRARPFRRGIEPAQPRRHHGNAQLRSLDGLQGRRAAARGRGRQATARRQLCGPARRDWRRSSCCRRCRSSPPRSTTPGGSIRRRNRPIRRRLRRIISVCSMLTPWPPTGLWAKRPVLTPSDLAGLTIRAYDETSRQVMAASSAKAVYLSFAEAMPRLKDGLAHRRAVVGRWRGRAQALALSAQLYCDQLCRPAQPRQRQ